MWWTVPAPDNELDRLIVVDESHQGAVPMQITTIGLDVAKNVFQVHGIDAAEKVIVRKQLRRGQMLAFFEGAAAFALWAWKPAPRPTIGARELTRSIIRAL